jgi:hypothetical protein
MNGKSESQSLWYASCCVSYEIIADESRDHDQIISQQIHLPSPPLRIQNSLLRLNVSLEVAKYQLFCR